MERLTYNRNGKNIEVEFDHFDELITYVVMNDVTDEEFESMETLGMKVEGGKRGLQMALLERAMDMANDRAEAERERDDANDYDEWETPSDEEDEFKNEFEGTLIKGGVYNPYDDYEMRFRFIGMADDDFYKFEPVSDSALQNCLDVAEDQPECWDGKYTYMSGETVFYTFFDGLDIDEE